MKKIWIALTAFIATALLLTGCGDGSGQSAQDNNSHHENNHQNDSGNTNSNEEGSSDHVTDDDEANNEDSNGSSINNDDENNSMSPSEKDEKGVLSDYSSEEIEYARVWLQLGQNQDIDELNAKQIQAGEPLNPDDDTSLDYPEDVVQLSGSRLVDGTITYSSNGDGTIHVYDIPQRWDGKNPAGEDIYEKLIENTEEVSIDSNDDEKVKELIEKLKISD
ncbi:MAG TPA: hypothetical protein VK111_11790 [Virgibacillus sp.]|nr:hypothetical protein [Virgibacillus sp.]